MPIGPTWWRHGSRQSDQVDTRDGEVDDPMAEGKSKLVGSPPGRRDCWICWHVPRLKLGAFLIGSRHGSCSQHHVFPRRDPSSEFLHNRKLLVCHVMAAPGPHAIAEPTTAVPRAEQTRNGALGALPLKPRETRSGSR
nr:hypothetical protein CFP56_58194 [Quercus suber]